uniref:Uncharacterized protein n=1 Tax=Amphiprion percula TaxID=161767 RepID=A0A3P8STY1_AMPPE
INDIEEGVREQATRLRSDLALSHQENRELQERLMVSEATVHAQAEQLKDYRDLLSESRLLLIHTQASALSRFSKIVNLQVSCQADLRRSVLLFSFPAVPRSVLPC